MHTDANSRVGFLATVVPLPVVVRSKFFLIITCLYTTKRNALFQRGYEIEIEPGPNRQNPKYFEC